MSLRILSGTIDGGDYSAACFYDSVTDWAFGPVFQGNAPEEDAQAFADWLPLDARTYGPLELESLYGKWIRERSAQVAARGTEIAMSEAERAFYEWWHANQKPYMPIGALREAFVAGWEAAEAARNERPSDV